MTTVDPTTKRMTAEKFADWVQLPENENRWFELVRGEVIELPPPRKLHGAVFMNVADFFNLPGQLGQQASPPTPRPRSPRRRRGS